ncbi:hypothetical protein [Macellibacteroides fermentans]|uniref:hypothetical protein n=1 Tax=Macellibacteroides fermentans TaxID=879969 RepID=UPI00352ECDF4
MKHSLKVIFGKEQVVKIYNNTPLSDEEIKLNVKEYQFNSSEEKQAFIKGLNEAIGWVDFCIPELEIA